MTEYLLVISVLVIAIVAVTYPMRQTFEKGSTGFKRDLGQATDKGHFGQSGER